MNKIPLFFLALLSQPCLASPLKLEQAIQEALNHSPALDGSRSALEEAKWKRSESFSGFLPTVSASANHLLSKKFAFIDVNLGSGPLSFPQIIPDTTYNLDARLPLFDGFANVNRYRAAGRNREAASLQLDWARFQLEHDVILLYYRALGAKLLEEVARQNVHTLEDHLKDVQLFKRAGASTNFDVLRVEVQVSEARSALLDSEDNTAIARQRLGEALGRPREDREIPGTLPVLESSAVAKASIPEKAARGDLLALSSRAEALEFSEDANAAFLIPRLYLFGDYQRYNNRDNQLFSNSAFRDAYQFGIAISWNIFDGLASYAKAKESVEQTVQAEKAVETAQIRAREDFEVWKRKFLYFCSVYSSRQSDVVKSREAVRLAREGRRVGARTNTDLLDAEAELNRSQAGSVSAQLGAIEALVNLELASGQNFYAFSKEL